SRPLRAPALVSTPVRGTRTARDAVPADPPRRPPLRSGEPRRPRAVDPQPGCAIELPARARAPDLLRRGAARPLDEMRCACAQRRGRAGDRFLQGPPALADRLAGLCGSRNA